MAAELAVNTTELPDASTAASNWLIDYMPLPPVTEDGALAEVPNLEFTKVSSYSGTEYGRAYWGRLILNGNNAMFTIWLLMFK